MKTLLSRIIKSKKVLLILLIVFIYIIFLFLKHSRERNLISYGNILIEKIENFRSKNQRLPSTLKEMGIEEKDDDQLHYNKLDSIRYIVSFGYGVGESIIYYSETRKWDDY